MSNTDLETLNVVQDGDFITTDGFLQLTKGNSKLYYAKRDFLFRGGNWRGNPQSPIAWKKINREFRNLVVGHSDLYLSQYQSMFLKLKGIKRIFSTNAHPVPQFVLPIPQGLTNFCDDSPSHRILGDTGHFLTAWERTPDRDPFKSSLYVNFGIDTNFRVRSKVNQIAREIPTAIFRRYGPTSEDRIAFLSDTRRYNFVLCPEGNGVDTVRIWETLYMGGIPIVKREKGMEQILSGLPIAWVDRWEQIRDLTFLQNSWQKISTSEFNVSKLRQSTWNRYILSNLY